MVNETESAKMIGEFIGVVLFYVLMFIVNYYVMRKAIKKELENVRNKR